MRPHAEAAAYVERRTCGTKRRFKSYEAAQHAIHLIRDSGGGLTKEHRPYKCPFCYFYHIGHTRR